MLLTGKPAGCQFSRTAPWRSIALGAALIASSLAAPPLLAQPSQARQCVPYQTARALADRIFLPVMVEHEAEAPQELAEAYIEIMSKAVGLSIDADRVLLLRWTDGDAGLYFVKGEIVCHAYLLRPQTFLRISRQARERAAGI